VTVDLSGTSQDVEWRTRKPSLRDSLGILRECWLPI